MSSVASVLNSIAAGYAASIAILGTIGNSLSFFICIRKRLRTTPTFIIIAFNVLCDIPVLYSWNLIKFFQVFFAYPIQDINEHTCKTMILIQFISAQSSSFLLVCKS